ncbi:MAG: DNA polymerase I [Clostridia bacterium]|nr:DNA polymerase I [Clostridia bacterium]
MRLLVIDGNSIINRAFYGIKLLTTKDGVFTNGIYGFMNILIRLCEECKPDRAAIAFDLKAPTFRHKMYDGYKAGRKGMPPELASQMPILKNLLVSLGYKVVECEGYEADDILGTLSASCKGDDLCFIATGDRDSLQLVSENTTVLLASTKMGKAQTDKYDVEAVKEKYGTQPKGLIEIKALMGDSSDNIPGVAGIGEKTACELISKFGTVDYIYENIDTIEIKDRVRQKLLDGKDSAYLSRTLGTICLTAPIDTDPDSYVIAKPDMYEAMKLLTSLEMFGLIEKLGLTAVKPVKPDEPKTEKKLVLREERDLRGLLGRLKNSGKAYFYTLFDGKIKAFFFADGDGVLYAPCDCLDFESFTEDFLSSDYEKYTCDVKALYHEALKRGIKLENVSMDTALAGYILNPSASAYDVLRLAVEYGVDVPEIECEQSVKQAALSAAVMPTLCEKIAALIEQNGQSELLYDVEIPLACVLADMERTGFCVDRQGIESFGAMLDGKINEIKSKIFEVTGLEFNLNSPKQLGEVLFEKMGLEGGKKTKTGWSTNADVLEKLSFKYPVVSDILEYRTLAKLKSTYCDGLLKVIGEDGRIRSTLNQTETRTGRISSTEPNLQNIPVRTELGREMRRFFTAADGCLLVDADYSQIELRVLSHIADDKIMQEAFNNGDDIHAITASQVFGMPVQMVTPLMRSRAKAVNFGIVYGIGAFSLAQDIGVTRKEAELYIRGYLENYSGVDAYMKSVVEKAREDGFAETLMHRRRYLPELTSSNKMLQAFGERVARNMPIQGTAADIIKIAMVRVHERLEKEKMKSRLIMQVHDELIVEAPENEAQRVKEILCEEMEKAFPMKVSLTADANIAKTWYEAK